MYNEALESVTAVLEYDPNNVKALYRCGKVLLIKGEYDEAVVNLQKATNLSPDERVRGQYQVIVHIYNLILKASLEFWGCDHF